MTPFRAIMVVIVCGAFLSTVRIAVLGFGHPPRNPVARVAFHWGWCAALAPFLVGFVGHFAHRDISAVPWVACSGAVAHGGIIDAIVTFAAILLIDLWVLWIPAHVFICKKPGLDRRVVVLARVLNVAIGLLFITPNNPIYHLYKVVRGMHLFDG